MASSGSKQADDDQFADADDSDIEDVTRLYNATQIYRMNPAATRPGRSGFGGMMFAGRNLNQGGPAAIERTSATFPPRPLNAQRSGGLTPRRKPNEGNAFAKPIAPKRATASVPTTSPNVTHVNKTEAVARGATSPTHHAASRVHKKKSPRPYKRRTIPAGGVATTIRKRDIIRVPAATVVPDDTIRQQVVRATAIVTEEIRSGVWPPLASSYDNHNRQLARSKQAACALEQFAMEVILPSLQSANRDPPGFCPKQQASKQSQKQPLPVLPPNKQPHERPFFATLLLLREAIAMNLETIFGSDPTIMIRQEENGDYGDVEEEEEGSKEQVREEMIPFPGLSRLKKQDEEEEKAFCSHLLATGLILAAVERLGKHLLSQVSSVFEKYDTGHEEFGSCLEPPDGRSVLVTPKGQVLDREETVSAKVGMDLARSQHPLITKHKKQSIMEPPHQIVMEHVVNTHETPLHQFSLPQPTACHVSIVEREPSTYE